MCYSVANDAYTYGTGFFDKDKARTLEGHSVNRNEYQMAAFGTVTLVGSLGMGAAETSAAREGAAIAGKESTGRMVGALREASQAEGNIGVGTLTRSETEKVGQAWVGEGARPTSSGKGMISADGTKVYRAPSAKNPKFASSDLQANLETRVPPVRSSNGQVVQKARVVGNGHIDVK